MLTACGELVEPVVEAAGGAAGTLETGAATGAAAGAVVGLTGAEVEWLGPELEGPELGRLELICREGPDLEWVEWAPEVSRLFPVRTGFTLGFKWLMVSFTMENLMTFSIRRRLRVTSAMPSVETCRWKKM